MDYNGAEVIIEDEPPEWNNSVWKCVYRKEKIKDLKFDPIYNYGEDKFFNEKLPDGKKTSITRPIYTIKRPRRHINIEHNNIPTMHIPTIHVRR